MNKQKVLLGMSGGVDSSASAILLQQKGYEVIGFTMILCDNNEQAVKDAKKVCEKLGIKHETLDLRTEFQKRVIHTFVKEYEKCRTPNPCIECNQYIKFGEFYKKAKELECDYIATGHYAKVEYSEKFGQNILKKSKEDKKDQTYFLYRMSKEVLQNIIFPLEEVKEKEEIRKLACENDLLVANKKDSEEICFIPDGDYTKFLKEQGVQSKKGNIILKDGTILGIHNGTINYTIGQRKGLGISYKVPLYVIALDAKKNQVIVGEEKELYSKELYANDLNFLLPIKEDTEILVKAKIRYRAKEANAKLKIHDNIAHVIFEESQRAITPGQSVVFYIEDDIVLGGGKIMNYKL